jgi:hypothetical protein
MEFIRDLDNKSKRVPTRRNDMGKKWPRLALGLMLLLSWRPCLGATSGRPQDATKKLTIHLGGQTAGATELLLLPKPQELTDADALPLYEKAVKAMPKDLNWEKITAWRQMPAKDLPLEDVASALRPFDAILPLLEQAAKCKRCDWPLLVGDDPPINLNACRNLAFLIALKGRSELARGDYASCVRTLGTGLALAKHLSAGPNAIHLLLGVAIGAIVYGEVEQYVQQPGAPSLEGAIRAIPKPMFDEKHSELYGMDEASRSKIQLLLRRANRHPIALQYIETLRRYATKAGKWPQTLDELKADLPNDPVTGKPFAYKRTLDNQVILEGPPAAGGDARKDAIRYELNLAK